VLRLTADEAMFLFKPTVRSSRGCFSGIGHVHKLEG
jgi:hypothetical protein